LLTIECGRHVSGPTESQEAYLTVRSVARAIAALCLAASCAQPVAAQPRGSERSTVNQVVNGTNVTLDFARPVARGRDNLFGGVVHWGEMWTPGANWATTFEVDGPVRLNGHEVPAGKYSVWMQPREGEAWAVILNREWRLYHDAPVPEESVFLTLAVQPQQGAHMEALNWYVNALSPRSATLRMHWGPTFVALDIETDEFTWSPLPAAERASYLGDYAFDTRDPTTGGPLQVTIGVLEEDGRIVGRWGRAPIALIPVGGGEFRVGFLRDGALFDVGDEMTLRVRVENGHAVGADLLWGGVVFGTAGVAR
jgi:hypothetical protein